MTDHTPEQAEPEPDVPAIRHGLRTWQKLALVPIVVVVLGGAYLAGQSMNGDDDAAPAVQIADADADAEFAWDFVIPAGTADRIAAGEDIEIIPTELVVHVGDAIRIVNQDTANHVVGVFYVAAGETLTQRFQSEGELEGSCSVHPSGAFTLRVEA